jgi:Na+/citrate or Na+/malate symporter
MYKSNYKQIKRDRKKKKLENTIVEIITGVVLALGVFIALFFLYQFLELLHSFNRMYICSMINHYDEAILNCYFNN